MEFPSFTGLMQTFDLKTETNLKKYKADYITELFKNPEVIKFINSEITSLPPININGTEEKVNIIMIQKIVDALLTYENLDFIQEMDSKIDSANTKESKANAKAVAAEAEATATAAAAAAPTQTSLTKPPSLPNTIKPVYNFSELTDKCKSLYLELKNLINKMPSDTEDKKKKKK